MSRALISRSKDLARLRAEGYEIGVVHGHLIVKNVPYVNAQQKVKRGTLVSTLALAGEQTVRPDTHVVSFIGDQPCNKDGSEISQIVHQQEKKLLAEGLEVDRSFSNKPANGYDDYHAKMTTYANIISGPAESLDPTATAKTFVVESDDEGSPFMYADTASGRAEIGAVSLKLAKHKVAIVGLGGTGSYVLDLMAKTPVSEIHLFDGDRYLQHNAFRSPGAPSLDELRNLPTKVEYLRAIYSRMHRGIKAHPVFLDRATAGELAKMDFVFLCVDNGRSRKETIEVLHQHAKSFIEVGMGIERVEGQPTLIGTLRVSTSTPAYRHGERRISTAENDLDDEYDKNIQIADLNCLNAALAVIRWKKLCGFYQDREREHLTVYSINTNQLTSEELQ